jgi:alpha-amylase
LADLVLCFQAHQPYRLRRYTAFDASHQYFDDRGNESILRRIAERCYRPTFALFEQMIADDGAGRQRVGLTLGFTGTLIEQWREHAPDLIDKVRALVATGRVEILGETSHHSLASLMPIEFEQQILDHASRIHRYFGVRPRVFRNTELIYADAIAGRVAAMRDARFEGGRVRGILAEGVDSRLNGRSPAGVWRSPAPASMPVMLRDHQASDDLAFRFADPSLRRDGPLTPSDWLGSIRARSPHPQALHLVVIDLETLGEHLPEHTGIIEFFRELPRALAEDGGAAAPHRLLTASEALERHSHELADAPVWSCPEATSWADRERDLSAWLGNAMQREAFAALAKLPGMIHAARREADIASDGSRLRQIDALMDDWRRLSTSDHLYYLSTKGFARAASNEWEESKVPDSDLHEAATDGGVHAHFSPYDSPYEACVNLMNVLEDLDQRARALG